jgi:hypothetical protein
MTPSDKIYMENALKNFMTNETLLTKEAFDQAMAFTSEIDNGLTPSDNYFNTLFGSSNCYRDENLLLRTQEELTPLLAFDKKLLTDSKKLDSDIAQLQLLITEKKKRKTAFKRNNGFNITNFLLGRKFGRFY